jgi:hypothetical protein
MPSRRPASWPTANRPGLPVLRPEELRRVMAVPANARGTMWRAANPTKFFEGGTDSGGGFNHYDVSPDGQRFLTSKRAL